MHCLEFISDVTLPFHYQSYLLDPRLRKTLGFLNIEYLIPVFTVFAAVGIQLIEPFYCKTISTEATHTLLKEFYQEMDAAKVNQADSIYKNLINRRQSLDKCDDEDLETVKIDDISYDISEKMTGYEYLSK